MKNNIVINISAQTLHLAKILYLELWDYRLSVNQIAGFFKVKILWTKWGLMLIFCFQINIKALYKLILLSLVSLVQYAQVANQIAKFLEGHYLKKDLMDCIDFCHKDLQAVKNFSILDACVAANTLSQSYCKIIWSVISREWVWNKWFLASDIHQSF